MLFQILASCWLVASAQASVLFAKSKAWNQVVKATMETHATYVDTEPALSEWELQQRFEDVWDGLLHLCPSLPEDGKRYIDVGFDDALLNEANPPLSRVLGWASRTELLSKGVWSGALATREGVTLATGMGLTTLGTLRVARQPPGGWFRGAETVCRYRFRLEDVLLHELLHLLGVSSSVRELEDGSLAVGAEYMGTCFPGAFDREIADEDGNMVVGTKCEFSGSLSQPLFVNGARLYAETGQRRLCAGYLSFAFDEHQRHFGPERERLRPRRHAPSHLRRRNGADGSERAVRRVGAAARYNFRFSADIGE